jgi:hypothetical protein
MEECEVLNSRLSNMYDERTIFWKITFRDKRKLTTALDHFRHPIPEKHLDPKMQEDNNFHELQTFHIHITYVIDMLHLMFILLMIMLPAEIDAKYHNAAHNCKHKSITTMLTILFQHGVSNPTDKRHSRRHEVRDGNLCQLIDRVEACRIQLTMPM